MASRVAADIVSYDSGGGSFQIVAVPLKATSESQPPITVHEGPFGEIEALRVLEQDIRQRGLRKGVSPNPVTQAEADQLVARLKGQLPPLHPAVVARLQQQFSRVVAIGESTSIFAIAATALGGDRQLTVAKVQSVIATTCDKDDKQQAAMGLPEVHLTLPKLCLLAATMETYNLDPVCLSRAEQSGLRADDCDWL